MAAETNKMKLINAAANKHRKGRNLIVQPQFHISQTNENPVKAFTMQDSMRTTAIELDNLMEKTSTD